MKPKVPINWIKENDTEYSFRFHSYGSIYESMKNNINYKERWWSGSQNTMAWTECEGDVNLDIKMIIRCAKGHRITFNKLLSHCISHEIMHSILTRDIDDNVSHLFENICSNKNVNLREWFGGMA